MSGYLARDPKGLVKVARLPATDDPIATRVERIRQRDAIVIDTVNGYYANFSDQMSVSYGQWRRASFEEIEKEQRALNQARTRTYLGAAAVLASVFRANQCGVYDYNCQRVQSAARYGGAIGGTAAILSGLKKYSDAKVHAQALREMSDTFQSEVAAAGHRRRGAHAQAHRDRRGAVPGVAQDAARSVPGGKRHSGAGGTRTRARGAPGTGRGGCGTLMES